MEFYSPDADLKKTFGKEIKDETYISKVTQLCLSSDVPYQSADFIPHNLLLNWNEIVEMENYGDENTEDFQLDFGREILFEIEKDKSLIEFKDHKTFLNILELIDEKIKLKTFIPTELKNEKRWWNCLVFQKGTQEYKNRIEQDMFEKFNLKLDLKNRIEKL